MNFPVLKTILIQVSILMTCIYAQYPVINYSADPTHRDLVIKAFQLALEDGFSDSNLSEVQILDRLEAGVYSEDYESIPGEPGSHFPNPWDQGPDFDFAGLYPVTKIPYGKLTDTSSGWYRGLMHGFDPVQGFLWPGASESTIEWANSSSNSYTWNNTLFLYHQGDFAEAYQCLGHLLHLLMDMSVPAHIKVVDHGGSLESKHAGTIINPDIGKIIIDEYEQALGGGLQLQQLPGVYIIPDLRSELESAIDSSKAANIPVFTTWYEYFDSLASYTYRHPLVNQYYSAPDSNGNFGHVLDSEGSAVSPRKYGTTLPAEIAGRITQFSVYGTVRLSLPVVTTIPRDEMISMCMELVPKAVEYSAGLIQHFYRETVTDVLGGNTRLNDFRLKQNYPNPFNPLTTIEFSLPKTEYVELKVYNILGKELTTLVSKNLNEGNHTYTFDGNNLASGIYYYKLVAGDPSTDSGQRYSQVQKMILLK